MMGPKVALSRQTLANMNILVRVIIIVQIIIMAVCIHSLIREYIIIYNHPLQLALQCIESYFQMTQKNRLIQFVTTLNWIALEPLSDGEDEEMDDMDNESEDDEEENSYIAIKEYNY